MYKSVFSIFFLLIISFKSFSQSDSIIINQDPKLKKVIELKKIGESLNEAIIKEYGNEMH